MKKILSLLKYVLLAVSIVALAFVVWGGEGGINFILGWAYVLLGLAIVVTILFPIFNLAQNPAGAMRSLIGLAVVVVVLGISYALSSTEPVVDSAGGFFTNPTELKISDTGLITTYIAMGGAILVVLFGEIRNSFK